MMFNHAFNAVLTIVDQRNFYCNCYIKNVLSLRNDCSNNLNLWDHMLFFGGKISRSPFTKNRKNQHCFICDDINTVEWDTWFIIIFNGHFRWINCLKVVSKTKSLLVKDKTVLTSFDRYSAYQGKSLHICLGFVPTQICTRQMAHLDNFVCDI